MFSGVPNGPLRLSPPQVHAAVHNSGVIPVPSEHAEGMVDLLEGGNVEIEVNGRRGFGEGPGVTGKGTINSTAVSSLMGANAQKEKDGSFVFHFSVTRHSGGGP